jgi:hypothetical protein
MRLWVIEQVLLPAGGSEPPERAEPTLLYLNMLLRFGGGQERIAKAYRVPIGAAGFGEVAILSTDTVWTGRPHDRAQ